MARGFPRHHDLYVTSEAPGRLLLLYGGPGWHGYETDPPTVVFSERTVACREVGTTLPCVTIETGAAPSMVNGSIAAASWTTTKRVRVGPHAMVKIVDATTPI